LAFWIKILHSGMCWDLLSASATWRLKIAGPVSGLFSHGGRLPKVTVKPLPPPSPKELVEIVSDSNNNLQNPMLAHHRQQMRKQNQNSLAAGLHSSQHSSPPPPPLPPKTTNRSPFSSSTPDDSTPTAPRRHQAKSKLATIPQSISGRKIIDDGRRIVIGSNDSNDAHNNEHIDDDDDHDGDGHDEEDVNETDVGR
jgi:hypothetical protein